MSDPTTSARVVRAGVTRGESGLLCAYQEAYLVELEADIEGWIVLAPHDQPPVPADVAAEQKHAAFMEGVQAGKAIDEARERGAFEAGWDCVALTDHTAEAIAAAYAAYLKRKGER